MLWDREVQLSTNEDLLNEAALCKSLNLKKSYRRLLAIARALKRLLLACNPVLVVPAIDGELRVVVLIAAGALVLTLHCWCLLAKGHGGGGDGGGGSVAGGGRGAARIKSVRPWAPFVGHPRRAFERRLSANDETDASDASGVARRLIRFNSRFVTRFER